MWYIAKKIYLEDIFSYVYIYTRYIYMYIYIVKKKCKKKQIYSIICVFTLCVPPLLSFYSEKRFKTRGLFPYMVRVFWAKSVCQLLQPWQTDWVPCHAFLAAKGLCRARLEIRTCRTILWLPPNPRQAKGVHRYGTSKTICIILLFKQSQIQVSWKNVFVVAETSFPRESNWLVTCPSCKWWPQGASASQSQSGAGAILLRSAPSCIQIGWSSASWRSDKLLLFVAEICGVSGFVKDTQIVFLAPWGPGSQKGVVPKPRRIAVPGRSVSSRLVKRRTHEGDAARGRLWSPPKYPDT
jgi:hypothetical protein